MVSEDSRFLATVALPIPAPSIHGERSVSQPLKPLQRQVLSSTHRSDDAGEREELLLFGAEERMRLEEGDHALQEVGPVSDHEHQTGVRGVPVVLLDPSAAEAQLDQVEDLTAFSALPDVELGHELPTGSRAWVPLDGYMK